MTFARRRLFTTRRLRLLGVLLVVVYVVAQFAAFRASLDRVPASWTVAGTPFAGQRIDEVVALMQAAFDEPVILHYMDEVRALPPDTVGFRFDAEATVEAFRRKRAESATAGNFLRHLIFQQPEPYDLPIVAEYSEVIELILAIGFFLFMVYQLRKANKLATLALPR